MSIVEHDQRHLSFADATSLASCFSLMFTSKVVTEEVAEEVLKDQRSDNYSEKQHVLLGVLNLAYGSIYRSAIGGKHICENSPRGTVLATLLGYVQKVMLGGES